MNSGNGSIMNRSQLLFSECNNLGGRAYYTNNESSNFFLSLQDYMSNTSSTYNEIDQAAVLGVLMKNYPLGTRTLIKGVNRTPWMAEPNEHGNWYNLELAPHKNLRIEPKGAALELGRLLHDEALSFISGKNTIGILLSGGMDSRIVAGVVRQLQKSGEFSGDVVALTWGISGSRDVVYAEEIARIFGWEHKHYPLTPEVLERNIVLTAERGAEYSPVHLHCMEDVSKTEGLDGVLAGSYGDSIGRGEYSGRRTDQLPGILDKHLNHFALLPHSIEKSALIDIRSDLILSRQRFPGRSEDSYREIEMQMHYMRRQLNACMEVIDDKIPLYQMFGAPEVFSFMWSLSSECRTDDVYEQLLNLLPSELHNIPWARTGKLYNQSNQPQKDSLLKLNNRYGKWLRNDLRNLVLNLVRNGSLQGLGIFNEKSLEMWAQRWPTNNSPKADRLDEKMAWLASLAIFVEKYDVQSIKTPVRLDVIDKYSQVKAFTHTRLYQLAAKYLGS